MADGNGLSHSREGECRALEGFGGTDGLPGARSRLSLVEVCHQALTPPSRRGHGDSYINLSVWPAPCGLVAARYSRPASSFPWPQGQGLGGSGINHAGAFAGPSFLERVDMSQVLAYFSHRPARRWLTLRLRSSKSAQHRPHAAAVHWREPLFPYALVRYADVRDTNHRDRTDEKRPGLGSCRRQGC